MCLNRSIGISLDMIGHRRDVSTRILIPEIHNHHLWPRHRVTIAQTIGFSLQAQGPRSLPASGQLPHGYAVLLP